MTESYEATRAVYAAQRVGGGSVGVGDRIGVLVVDFQHLYTRGRASTGLRAVERTAELLAVARSAGLPVAYAVVGYPEGAMPDDHTWTMKCPGLLEATIGSLACTVDPLITPQPGEVVMTKQVPSALFDPSLREAFRADGVDTLLVAGTSTSGCVRATVVDGVSHGFHMLVVSDCVADRSEPSAQAALFDIETKYGDVISLAQATAHVHGAAVGP